MTDVAYFIPARTGSERVPRKNWRPFAGGASLVVRKAQAVSRMGGEVIVSTDIDAPVWGDGSHAPIVYGRGFDASHPITYHCRSGAASSSTAHVEQAIEEWLTHASVHQEKPAIICVLNPTSPFLEPASIMTAVAAIRGGKYQGAIAVTEERDQSPFQGWITESRVPEYRMGRKAYTRPRTQDLTPVWRECGALYAFTLRHWENTGSIAWAEPTFPLKLGRNEARDINDMDDWREAEMWQYALDGVGQ